LRDWLDRPLVRALLALAVVIAVGLWFHADGTFYKLSTHTALLRQVSVFGILACGMTLVIVSGGIDLSVGSVLGLSAVLFSLTSIHWGWHAGLAIPFTLAAGLACGAVSGGLVAGFRMQPFIATLAMMVFARGLAKWLSGGEKISQSARQEDGSFAYLELPPVFEVLDAKYFGGTVAAVTLIFLGCALLTGLLLTRLRAGRHLYAIGGNPEAARLSGIPVNRTRVMAYGLSGLLAAVAGICQAAQEYQGDPETGAAYELTAIAMVVLGGTSLSGGAGGIPLTLLGVLTIGYLEKILSINAVGESSRLMLTGAIVAGAVILQQGKSRWSR
jgi:ribose transport system permease protein